MIYLDPKPSENGAYPNPKGQSFPNCIPVSDEYLQTIIQYNGFVIVSEDGTVTPNIAAWEKWKAEQPEPEDPEPTAEEKLKTLESKHAALQESHKFLEECLVEMAAIVYA